VSMRVLSVAILLCVFASNAWRLQQSIEQPNLPKERNTKPRSFSSTALKLYGNLRGGETAEQEELLDNQGVSYRLRPFDLVRDQLAVEEICKDVYGGMDYVPHRASSYASDPECCFLVLEDTSSGQVVALANVRRLKPNMAWLEAVRTSEKYRGKGLAAQLTQHLILRCKSDNLETFSSTDKGNRAMQRVFGKTCMLLLHKIHVFSFAKLQEWPGWFAEDPRTAQSLLVMCGLEANIGDEARAMKWTRVETAEELAAVLQEIRAAGRMGHLPGHYKLLSEDEANESLARGRIWKMSAAGAAAAVIAFNKDEQETESLRSKWVCSIAATTPSALDSALWQAHSEACLSTLGGDVAFLLAIDAAIPDGLGKLLPLNDPFLLFGTSALP